MDPNPMRETFRSPPIANASFMIPPARRLPRDAAYPPGSRRTHLNRAGSWRLWPSLAVATVHDRERVVAIGACEHEHVARHDPCADDRRREWRSGLHVCVGELADDVHHLVGRGLPDGPAPGVRC